MENEKTWKIVLDNLKVTLSPANFATWFSQTFLFRVKEIDENRQIVEIACPSTFVANTIENRYYGIIKDMLDENSKKKNDLVFIVKQAEKNSPPENSKEPLFNQPPNTEAEDAARNLGLRPDFTFDNFAVSSTNQMAHAAAQAVAQTPGKAYNPLFLYGGVGVGKTHLMQAVANAILIKNPRIKIIYCTGEEFTNEIVDAIRKKTTNEFKQRYRTAKLLMVDDIQFIAGKERAQEEFFHTFNSIWKVGGQIILTSDRRPEEISELEDRLRSRFEGGLTIDIQPPDFELRSAILLIKAQQRGVKLPMDVAQMIAGNITSTRKLEGFLVRLAGESQTKNIPITPELAEALLGQTNGTTSVTKRLVKPKEIIRCVALHFNLRLSELIGVKRDRPIAFPRQITYYLLRTESNIPLMEIGRLFGGKDHTTVMYGVDKITKLLSSSEDLRVDIAEIKKRLYG